MSFGVATRDELAAWTGRLDELGIQHTGIRDEQQPLAYSTVVFRDRITSSSSSSRSADDNRDA